MKSTIRLGVWVTTLLSLILVSNITKAKILSENPNQPPQEHRGDIFISGIETVQSQYSSLEKPFLIKKRSPALRKSDCETCHKDDVKTNSNTTGTHNDINLMHAAKQGMNCLTCHAMNNVELLKNVNSTQIIEIDHAYLSCQGCHFSQARDWAGGAHGKRVRIWAEPRIVYNCTECHNPHNPTFKKRWPKIISTLPEKK